MKILLPDVICIFKVDNTGEGFVLIDAYQRSFRSNGDFIKYGIKVKLNVDPCVKFITNNSAKFYPSTYNNRNMNQYIKKENTVKLHKKIVKQLSEMENFEYNQVQDEEELSDKFSDLLEIASYYIKAEDDIEKNRVSLSDGMVYISMKTSQMYRTDDKIEYAFEVIEKLNELLK